MRTRTLTTGLAVLGVLATPAVYAATASADPDGDNIVITEVVSRFPNVSNDDANAVELHNPTANAIGISNWEIVFFDSSNTPTASRNFLAGRILDPGESLVVKDPDFDLVVTPGTITVDYNLAFGATDGLPDSGGVALFDALGVRVDGFCTDIGVTNACEGSPAPALGASTDGMTLQRDHATDTNNNGADFSAVATWGTLKH